MSQVAVTICGVDGVDGVDGGCITAPEQWLSPGISMEQWLREFAEGQHRTQYISRRSRQPASSRDFVIDPFMDSSESEEEEGDEMMSAFDLIQISNEFKAIREENAKLKSDNAKLNKIMKKMKK